MDFEQGLKAVKEKYGLKFPNLDLIPLPYLLGVLIMVAEEMNLSVTVQVHGYGIFVNNPQLLTDEERIRYENPTSLENGLEYGISNEIYYRLLIHDDSSMNDKTLKLKELLCKM